MTVSPRADAPAGLTVADRAQAIVDALYEQDVYTWNGHGRVRISFHGYNTMSDMERTAEALRQAL